MLVPSEKIYSKIKHLGVQDLMECAGLGLPQPSQYANQKATADAWGEIGSAEYHDSKKARYGNVVAVCVAELLRRAGKPTDIESIVDEAISNGFLPSSADWRGRDLKKGLNGYVKSAIKRGLLVERSVDSATYLVATSSGPSNSLSASDSLNRNSDESIEDESDFALPEEVGTEAMFVEGSVRRVAVNAYERDPKIRDACIAAHGSLCSICGFDFGKAYGDVASGFVHVHHLRPLATAGGSHTVDPVKDLLPVCPNCHAVIHLGGSCRSIDEVRELLRIERKNK